MTHLGDLLQHLTHTSPGAPRITWYVRDGGPSDGERVELSGAVLANWASKAANLLKDELGVEPGAALALDLPPHWRSLYWAVAAWAVGAGVVTDGEGDVLVTADPSGRTGADGTVVVTLPALSRSAGVPLPPGAIDEARELATYGDAFTPYDRAGGSDPALDDPALSFDLPPAAAADRVLLTCTPADALGPWLARVVTVVAAGGSVVAVRTGPEMSADALGRIAAQERATLA